VLIEAYVVNHGVNPMKSVQNRIATELSRRLSMSVLETDFDILLPLVKLPNGSDRNTRAFIQFKSSFPQLTKSVSVDYDRIHVSELGEIKTAKLTAVKVSDVLAQINQDYALDIGVSDFTDENLDLPDSNGLVKVEFKFVPDCLKFYSGTEVQTIAIQSPGEQNKSDVTYAVLDVIRSSASAHISNLGYDLATRQYQVARGNLPALIGKYQYEVTIAAGGGLIGFVTSNARVDLEVNRKPGFDLNGWMLDTGTGEFYTNDVKTQLSRSFTFGETLAVIVDKATGIFTIKDEQGVTYSTAPTDIKLLSAVYPAFASNSEFVSKLHINFGQEPFIISTADVIKGYYKPKV
jgi:hypothetical protein